MIFWFKPHKVRSLRNDIYRRRSCSEIEDMKEEGKR
jgi:hypothetical protein